MIERRKKMKMRAASLQMNVITDRAQCLEYLEHCMTLPEVRGADLLTLPEMFCSPYQTSAFPEYAEPEGGEMWQALSAFAKKHGIWLSAGSVPERTDDGRIFNTAYVFDRDGRQAAKHRKIHLFDIDVTGGQYFRESDTLSAGNAVTTFETEFCTVGLCICFDIRFPELFREMVRRGAKVILVPAAFNMTTGPAHWEILNRARAVDYQVYMVSTSTARDCGSSYVSYGNSMMTDPWGTVLTRLGAEEGVHAAELDMDMVARIRRELPVQV